MAKSILIFDGDCGFCRRWVRYAQALTGATIDYEPYQKVHFLYNHIPVSRFREAVHYVSETGQAYYGAEAVFKVLARVPGYKGWLWLYRRFPGFKFLSEWGYKLIARRRPLFNIVTTFLFGKQILPARYFLIRRLFVAGLAVVYGIAFLSLLVQLSGLFGKNGIAPVHEYLNQVSGALGPERYFRVPTLFWLNSATVTLAGAASAGLLLSGLLLSGYVPGLTLLLLWLLYLSFVTVGQPFLSYQWDILLLEAGFLSVFLVPFLKPLHKATLGPAPLIIWLFRLLLFRLMLSSGLVKLMSGDPSWHQLKALNYHYYTQPLPHMVSWLAHQLPLWFHRMSTALVLGMELLLPWLYFFPRRPRQWAFLMTTGLMAIIMLTGNYGFFNILTVVIALFLLDDEAVKAVPFLGKWAGNNEPLPLVTRSRGKMASGLLASAGTFLLLTAALTETNRFIARPFQLPQWQLWLPYVQPFALVNTYGLFAVMTTHRYELIIEATEDGNTWKPYEFKWKPGDPTEAPKWALPHQPRLDWQMWFAALQPSRLQPWVMQLMLKLLHKEKEVLVLIKSAPYENPVSIRASLYEYRFTTTEKKRKTGQWWQREKLGEYPPITSRGGAP